MSGTVIAPRGGEVAPHSCTCQRCLSDAAHAARIAEVRPSTPRPLPALTREELLARADAIERHDQAAGLAAKPAAKVIIGKGPIATRIAEARHRAGIDARAPLHDAQSEDLELRTAQLDATLDDLAAIVRILIRAGGYMAPEDQVSLRAAMARLVEHGRSVEDAPAPPTARSTR